MTKTCENCAHRSGNDPYFYYCNFYQTYCDMAVSNMYSRIRCGYDRVAWKARPQEQDNGILDKFFNLFKNKQNDNIPFTEKQEEKIKDLVAEAIKENNKKICVELENTMKSGGAAKK